MRLFDPSVWHANLTSSLIAIETAKQREHYLPDAVGNAAVLGLQTCVYAYLVGLDHEVEPLIRKYRNWLEDSLIRNEQFGSPPCYFAALRYEALALVDWLCENRLEQVLHEQALLQYQRTWQEIGGSSGLGVEKIREHYAADFLRNCVLGRAYARGVAFWEQLGGRCPQDASDIMEEAEMGYWLCRQSWGPSTRDAKALEAAARVFTLRLESDWLVGGQALRTAAWLQAVYWESAVAHTPKDTLSKAYEFMPHVAWRYRELTSGQTESLGSDL